MQKTEVTLQSKFLQNTFVEYLLMAAVAHELYFRNACKMFLKYSDRTLSNYTPTHISRCMSTLRNVQYDNILELLKDVEATTKKNPEKNA